MNIYEILKSRRQGIKLYSPICGSLSFNSLNAEEESKEAISAYHGDTEVCFYKNGRYFKDGQLILFPSKSMCDWSKFFKRGDIIECKYGANETAMAVFDKWEDAQYTQFTAKFIYVGGDFTDIRLHFTTKYWSKSNDFESYLKALEKHYGGSLNRDTMMIDKPQPEFKEGDILVLSFWYENRKVHCPLIFKKFTSATEFVSYAMKNAEGELSIGGIMARHSLKGADLRYADADEKEDFVLFLKANGKRWNNDAKQIEDIKVELKPLDYVLAKFSGGSEWVLCQYSHTDKDGCTILVGGNYTDKQVIPYAGNEELLGKTI